MNPPINGSIILGNEYTEYNKLNYVVDKCNFPFSSYRYLYNALGLSKQ